MRGLEDVCSYDVPYPKKSTFVSELRAEVVRKTFGGGVVDEASPNKALFLGQRDGPVT